MVKLGTLYPDGRVDDLGSVNGGLVPGEDSARRAEEYGWETWYEDTPGAFYAGGRVEETDDMKYMLGIEVTDMGDACGGECMRTLYTADGYEDADGTKHFENKEELRNLILGHPDSEAKILEWYDEPGFTADSPDFGDEAWEWAEELIDEVDYTEMHTSLLVIPVSIPESKARQACGVTDEEWEERKKEREECGDWRHLAWDFSMYGYKVPVANWSSHVECGEWPTNDLQAAKMAGIQVSMLLGFFLDQRVNQIGESGWDWIRNAGVIFYGDEIVWEDHEGRYVVSEINRAENTCTLDSLGEDIVGESMEDVPMGAIRPLEWNERLQRRLDAQAEDSRAEEDSAEAEEGEGEA